MFSIDATSHRSPNHDARPGTVRGIVLHSGEGSKASDLYTLCNDKVAARQRVSAHYYVDRAGAIYQLVADERRAWHAGVSSYLGLTDWNDFAIGIETEHQIGQLWPDVQRAALAWLCRQLIARHQIEQRLVVAHRWIAPDRKADPTNWPDVMLRMWIAALYDIAPPPPPPQIYEFPGIPIFQRADRVGAIIGYLPTDSTFAVDAWTGSANAAPDYAPHTGHLVAGGFIDLSAPGIRRKV